MKQRFGAFGVFAAVVAIAASAVLAVSLASIFRYGIAEGRALTLVSVLYLALGLWSFRRRGSSTWPPPWAILAGVTLAGLEVTNIFLEQFVGLPSPANAVVPASMMALIVLAASTAAVVGSAGNSVVRGSVCAVAVVGLGMLLSVSAVLVMVAVRAASLLKLTCANATMHLTLAPVLAAIVGSAAAAISAIMPGDRLRGIISLGGIAVFGTGVRLLVLAASLQRAQRPPLVVPGMALCALGLILLPCVLGRRAQTA